MPNLTQATGTCSCGCGSTTTVAVATEACGCGCGDTPRSEEQEVVSLLSRRDEIERRLQELGVSV